MQLKDINSRYYAKCFHECTALPSPPAECFEETHTAPDCGDISGDEEDCCCALSRRSALIRCPE